MAVDMLAHRHIENLLATYAELVDDGDFAGVGALLANAVFIGRSGPVSGAEAIQKMLEDGAAAHANGTAPITRHMITNLVIEVDEEAGTASARSYFAVLRALPGESPVIVASGRYRDRFHRYGGEWRFTEHRALVEFTGPALR
jgi:3-phenylpropionate/cinnamic acid dioxygenase small subunit